MIPCACGNPATANGRECARCFRNRLLSIRLDTSVTPTRSVRNYFDPAPLDETFGEDRVDRYWEETDGQGALKRGPDGNLWHQPFNASEPRVATPEVIDSFLGPEADDVV